MTQRNLGSAQRDAGRVSQELGERRLGRSDQQTVLCEDGDADVEVFTRGRHRLVTDGLLQAVEVIGYERSEVSAQNDDGGVEDVDGVRERRGENAPLSSDLGAHLGSCRGGQGCRECRLVGTCEGEARTGGGLD